MPSLNLGAKTWDDIHRYLDHPLERMAFLAARPSNDDPAVGDAWTVLDVLYLDDESDYVHQHWGGVELADHIRPQALKWSAALNAALIEVHSHGLGRTATTFSTTDLRGLKESAPSLLWRLGGRPYGAIVVGGRKDHDSLWWTSASTEPVAIAPLNIDATPAMPTGLAPDRLRNLKGN